MALNESGSAIKTLRVMVSRNKKQNETYYRTQPALPQPMASTKKDQSLCIHCKEIVRPTDMLQCYECK